jgi:hypothetical protein
MQLGRNLLQQGHNGEGNDVPSTSAEIFGGLEGEEKREKLRKEAKRRGLN